MLDRLDQRLFEPGRLFPVRMDWPVRLSSLVSMGLMLHSAQITPITRVTKSDILHIALITTERELRRIRRCSRKSIADSIQIPNIVTLGIFPALP